MRAMENIAGDVKSMLASYVKSTHFLAGGTADTSIREDLKVLSGANLPAAVIIPQGFSTSNGNLVNTCRLRILLLNAFSAGGDAKATSAWTLAEQVRGLFPDTGRTVQNVFYLPVSAGPASGVLFAGHAVYAIDLLLQE